MEPISDKLDKDFKTDLKAIRSAIEKLDDTRLPGMAQAPVELIEQANRLIACFENWLLDDEQIEILRKQPPHLFILYAAAYLCGIGRTDGEDASEGLIRNHWKNLGVADKALADIIARVCIQTGGDESNGLSAAGSKAAVIDGAVVNVPLLSACLRLGWALDLKSAVTLSRIYGYLPQNDRFAPDRLEGYFSVSDVGPHPYLNSTIRLKIQCTDPEIHRALKHHERSVQQMLESMNQRVRPRFLYSDVIYEIEPEGYTPIDLKFSVDSSAGLQLFMGNRLYSDKRVFLRELIQNAVDACNYRKLVDDSYLPEISIEVSDDISVIKMRDNGIGMTRQWFEKYFLAIGISFYQSNEIRDINQDTRIDFGFISQFGIGFLSSFQVAEKIVIKTRREGFAGLMITINSLRDYFDVRDLEEDFPVGTEVTLHLKKSKIKYCRSLEFAGYLKTNIRFLNIPVKLKDERGNIITIGREQLAYQTDNNPGPVFIAPLKF